jgi:hypothetical protein
MKYIDTAARLIYHCLKAGNTLEDIVLLSKSRFPELRGKELGETVGRMLNILMQERTKDVSKGTHRAGASKVFHSRRFKSGGSGGSCPPVQGLS